MSGVKSLFKKRWIRILLIAAGVLGVLVVVLSFSLTRYIEQHSEEWTGRKIKLSAVWFNPFNCSISLRDVKVYEYRSESVFVAFDELYVNASPWSYVIDGEIRFSEITLERPAVHLKMNSDDSFNYSDLIQRFGSSDESDTLSDSQPVRYVIENICIGEGALDFMQQTFNAGISLHGINASTGTVAWNEPAINYDLDFRLTTGGAVSAKGSYRSDSLLYELSLKTDSLAVDFLLPFADKVLYVRDVTGEINSDLRIIGTTSIPVTSINGRLSLAGFHVADTVGKRVAAIERLALDFGDVQPVKGLYNIRLARVDKPYLRFDITPAGNNLLRLSGSGDDPGAAVGDTVAVANDEIDPYLDFFKLINQYFIEWGREYAINSYAIDSLIISQGTLDFSDYTLKQPFHFLSERLNLSAYEITNASDSIRVSVHSSLNHSGRLIAGMQFNTGNLGDMNLHYVIDSLKIADFSPYSEYYVAHPFWDGIVTFESTTTVSNYHLNSRNRLFVTHLEVGDKVESITAMKLPLKLAVSLLKDVHGNVDLRIPLKGNVNDPKFRVMPVVWQVIGNLIVKAAASPYKLIARAVDAKEEDVRDIKFDYMQSDLRKRQNKTVTLLARILNQKKELTVNLIHVSNEAWETSQYALFKARLDYYATSGQKTELNFDDSLAADRISVSDTAFVRFVEQKTGKAVVTSDIETLCVELSGGQAVIQHALSEATVLRKQVLSDALIRKGVQADRFTISDASKEVIARHRERPKFDIKFDSESGTRAPSDSTMRAQVKSTTGSE